MPASALAQILLLLGSAVAIVLVFQRLRVPSVLAYLLIGVLLGPHTAGPVSYTHLRAHETVLDLVCRLLLEKNKTTTRS